ncbi:hypothetical protein BBO99_00002145 [Phytophthora kernoviae]|uniref:Uncharacterized protein n=1 Tax=Phytophthora kernoviae TaxID=325452 RepID=A0A3R7J3P5_9STRA|nr:hypothetical protein BBI17_002007 [Phytophthora kernoviae]RLN83461.1 hypothetical protein BBO99_00002145 [Phytophthora kernoviae]
MVSATRNNSLKKKDNATSAPAYERLYALAESKQKWIQRAQKAKEIEQARDQERMHNVEIMAAKSRELIAHRTNGGYAHIGDRFHGEALSDLAKKAQRHERRVAEHIGVNALWVASDKSQNDFVERLAVDKYRELERKRAALYDKYAPNRDPHTGKELFKPEIGRAPAFARNKQGLPIGDFLYAAHQEQQEYHRQLRDKDQREIKQKAQQNFVSEASRQALEKRKADTCSRIFKALLELSRQPSSSSSIPSATNGSISLEQMPKEFQPHKIEHSTQEKETNEVETVIPSQVDLTALPAEISRVVAIVFEFANHMPISRNAFLNYMDHLVGEIPGLTYTQILFLAEHLHDGKGSRHRHQQHHLDLEREAALAAAEQQELTFHPVINNNSREIATKHGRVASSKVFQALNQYFDHYQERKEQLRKQQQREFKKAHPFHPTFVTKAHQREPVATAFYDKIHLGNSKDTGNIVSWEVAASESSAPTLYGQLGAPLAPPAPLQTALSNARPSVRPIESEHTRFYTAADQEEAQFEDVSGEMSRSSSSSQLLEDADLTSRVLAALDEKPTKVKPTLSSLSSPSCSYHFFSPEKADSAKDDDNCMGKHGVVRSPEGATPDPMNFDDITDT